jgi:hypothetical protein
MLASALLGRATGALVVLGATYVLPALTLQAVDNLSRVGREVRYGSPFSGTRTVDTMNVTPLSDAGRW